MIRTFLDVETKRELHIAVEYEEFGVLVGMLCPGQIPTVLVEVERGSGIWREQNEFEEL
jgi:hypothetical protein